MPNVETILLVVIGLVVLFVVVAMLRAVRIVPQSYAIIVERLGKFQAEYGAGMHFLVPFIDRVRTTVDLREQVVSFPPQPVITSDNLVVSIDSVIYYQVTDPRRATYEIANYLQAIEQLTVTTLRNVIGSMDLEQTLTSRDQINGQLRGVLGQATGRQAKADSVVKDYTTKAEKAKGAIAVPQGATSVFTVPGDGTKGANAFTEEAPQVQLLKDLGFTIATVPDNVKGDQSMGDRKDIVQLSPENVQAGLTGENWVVIAADETAKNAVTSNETFSSAAPVTGGKVQYMPPSSFRLDYYSALEMLDAVQKAYPKAS